MEDVSSFITLAIEIGQLKGQEQLASVFTHLADSVHPLALGNVQRNYALIRSIARKLLRLHMSADEDALIKDIVNNLTEKLYAHNHMISRREAREDIKLTIINPDPHLERAMWDLYKEYEKELQLADPFNPPDLLSDSQSTVDFRGPGRTGGKYACPGLFVFEGSVSSGEIPGEATPSMNVCMNRRAGKRSIEERSQGDGQKIKTPAAAFHSIPQVTLQADPDKGSHQITCLDGYFRLRRSGVQFPQLYAGTDYHRAERRHQQLAIANIKKESCYTVRTLSASLVSQDWMPSFGGHPQSFVAFCETSQE